MSHLENGYTMKIAPSFRKSVNEVSELIAFPYQAVLIKVKFLGTNDRIMNLYVCGFLCDKISLNKRNQTLSFPPLL